MMNLETLNTIFTGLEVIGFIAITNAFCAYAKLKKQINYTKGYIALLELEMSKELSKKEEA